MSTKTDGDKRPLSMLCLPAGRSMMKSVEVDMAPETVDVFDISYAIAYGLLFAVGAVILSDDRRRRERRSSIGAVVARNRKHSFVSICLLCVVVVEFWYAARVAVKIPGKLESNVILQSCRDSVKGGKLPGSFRDCTTGQDRFCTKDNPCTPCDEPFPAFEFDGQLWPSECQTCSFQNTGKCEQETYCQRAHDGVIEPCQKCCVKVEKPLTCEDIYDNLPSRAVCTNASFPIPTIFGCCPSSSDRNANPLDDCMLKGPLGAHWQLCKNETNCPLYSNGIYQGREYCIPYS